MEGAQHTDGDAEGQDAEQAKRCQAGDAGDQAQEQARLYALPIELQRGVSRDEIRKVADHGLRNIYR